VGTLGKGQLLADLMSEIREHNAMKLIAVTLTTALFLFVGVVCAFYPHAVQRLAAEKKLGPILDPAMHVQVLREHIGSSRYVFELRIVGLLALTGAAVGLYSLLCEIWAYFG